MKPPEPAGVAGLRGREHQGIRPQQMRQDDVPQEGRRAPGHALGGHREGWSLGPAGVRVGGIDQVEDERETGEEPRPFAEGGLQAQRGVRHGGHGPDQPAHGLPVAMRVRVQHHGPRGSTAAGPRGTQRHEGREQRLVARQRRGVGDAVLAFALLAGDAEDEPLEQAVVVGLTGNALDRPGLDPA
jgi:hypothetical protein